jgi:A/G-specific adenine glycosylase
MVSVKHILHWYSLNKRSLPWRRDGISAYGVWVSEIMLQQTQVVRGVQYYDRFLKRFPTVQKLAEASWEDFLPYYEGLGYYARGRNMLQAAKIIASEFGREFPRDKNALMKLPGIGEYTACAILSFTWNEPLIAFDTNFKRIFGTREKAEKALLKSGVPSGIFNSAVMDYASAHPEPKKSVKSVKSKVHKVTTVVLHENHKKYFSEDAKKYKPFLMPKEIKNRAEIKKYFLEKYGLRVSVRPPDRGGIINTQILSGRPAFAIFDKKSYDKWRTKYKYIV